MRTSKNIFVGSRRWALLLCLSLALLIETPATAAPFAPTDNDQVIEQLPTPGDSAKRELRRLRARLSNNPDDLALAADLARRYIRIGRAESDPRYNGYAQAALKPWWDQPDPPAEVLVLRATLLQNRHEFDAALSDLSRVLSINPRNAQAWLTRAVILQVQGKFRQAMASCMRLKGLAQGLVQAACAGAAASNNGRAQEAYRILQQALARSPDAAPSLRLWALTIVAETAWKLGLDEEADRHFRRALDLGIRDAYLLSAYADFLLDYGREREVVELLEDETRADGFLLRLALAERRLNAPALAEHQAALEDRFAANRLRGGTIHLRAESRFTLHLLDDPLKALKLAKANWALQREPWDARLVLESAVAADMPSQADPVLAWLKETRLEDVRISELVKQLASRKTP